MADRIGDFLVKIGAMQPEEVEEVLKTQQAGDRRIFGEIAIDLGYINDEVIRRYLEYKEALQKKG